MFKEILKLIPKLDDASLAAMERSLSGRFGKLAKRFGSGIATALKGGGLIAAAGTLIDKLLNPLKETQEAIDRLLKQGDDIVTNAKQFQTTAGKLFVLQKLAKSTGLEPDSLNVLLTKYQTALAEAKADPKKETSARQFANDKDIAESFFQFIQELQKLTPDKQVLVQKEVFGEKQILKMADFIQTVGEGAEKQLKLIGAKGSETYTPGLEKTARLNDLQDALEARRELKDQVKKSALVNDSMVYAKDKAEQRVLDQENKRIASYESLRQMAELSEKTVNGIENLYLFLTQELSGAAKILVSLSDKIGQLLTAVVDWRNKMDNAIKNSRLWRGIFGGGDK